MRSTLHIKDIIRKKLRRTLTFVNAQKRIAIEPNVKNFLPERFHQYLSGITLKNKQLVIRVKNNAALMELENFYKSGILAYLQGVLPNNYRLESVIFKNS